MFSTPTRYHNPIYDPVGFASGIFDRYKPQLVYMNMVLWGGPVNDHKCSIRKIQAASRQKQKTWTAILHSHSTLFDIHVELSEAQSMVRVQSGSHRPNSYSSSTNYASTTIWP